MFQPSQVEERTFFAKARRVAGKVPFVKDAVALWFCMRDDKTPLRVKLQIAGALAYFVLPIDAVVDAIPFAGYVDDAAVIAATLRSVRLWIHDDHRRRAAEWLEG